MVSEPSGKGKDKYHLSLSYLGHIKKQSTGSDKNKQECTIHDSKWEQWSTDCHRNTEVLGQWLGSENICFEEDEIIPLNK